MQPFPGASSGSSLAPQTDGEIRDLSLFWLKRVKAQKQNHHPSSELQGIPLEENSSCERFVFPAIGSLCRGRVPAALGTGGSIRLYTKQKRTNDRGASTLGGSRSLSGSQRLPQAAAEGALEVTGKRQITGASGKQSGEEPDCAPIRVRAGLSRPGLGGLRDPRRGTAVGDGQEGGDLGCPGSSQAPCQREVPE